jgi:sugar lactone lactonase YvrE
MLIEPILSLQCELAEGPVWDEREQVLWWVNIMAGELHRFDPATQENRTFEIGRPLGAVGLREAGGLVLAMADGFAFFDPETKKIDLLTDPEKDLPGNRFNDGKPAPCGGFFAGTMSYKAEENAGNLYRLHPDGRTTRCFEGVTISNGLAWNTAENRMYYIDTIPRKVYVFDYDKATGNVSNDRVAFTIDQEMGFPDGMTIDTEDKLWIAHFDGNAVHRWDPETGAVLATIELPASKITCCTFGGSDLDTLYITSASEGMTPEEKSKEPLAGSLFRVQTQFKGRAAYRFNG